LDVSAAFFASRPGPELFPISLQSLPQSDVAYTKARMFCPNCGRENADDAVFCQRCGRAVEPEEETRVAQRGGPPADRAFASVQINARREEDPTEPAREIFSVSPTLLFVKIGYASAVAAAFLLSAIVAGVFRAVTPGGAVWLGLVLCLLFLIVPAFYHLRQKLVRYRLTETTVEIDRGLVSRTTQNIPLQRVQDVTVSATAFQRILGFGDIVIDNASESGGKVVLKNIGRPRKYADLLLRQMHLLDR
jgi:membrane protein YdbS with pleckstrin-like domain